LCNAHYLRARKTGEIVVRTGDRHTLTKIDLEAKRADCAVCGPGVRIKVRKQKGVARCLAKYRETSPLPTYFMGEQTPESRRRTKLKLKYGITPEDYERMFEEQGGVCAVCEKPSAKRLCVDHDHATGIVRGLLCTPCNLSLGYLRDDSYNAVSAAKYLLKVTRRADR
jgi:ribosomal protein L37E